MEATACEIGRLPEELLSAALARTSPCDACRAAAVSPAFRAAADSDSVWACFLPHAALPPLADGELPAPAPRKKDLFLRLSDSPVLLQDKLVSMWLDRETGAKCYMLSARDLYICWGDTPQYWNWIPLTDSSGREMLLPVPSGIRVHEDEPAPDEDYWSEEMPVRKLVVCPDGLVAAIVGHERSSKVALCKPESAWSWSLRTHDPWLWFADMAFFDGKLHALTNDGDLFALEVGHDDESGIPRISQVEHAIDGGSCHYPLQEYTRLRYLVVRPRRGDLLMVCRIMLEYGSTTHEFAVFRADLGSSQWVQLNTLGGDEALFVGRLCSRVVRADRYGVRGDQIFFLDDSYGMQGPGLYMWDAFANVYDMKDGSVREVLPMHSYGDSEVPATWLFREEADPEE